MGDNSQLLDHLQACHVSTLKIIRVEEGNERKEDSRYMGKKREKHVKVTVIFHQINLTYLCGLVRKPR